eukprot:CAMPEP_0174265124 /NCGR_PEP_ID=MMETSP0439-20130205/25377_1 /TAXON_ID=0 /ORGANISM="Stereomyxa ramosa, Strain Chinc5" /LENGTH=374 /DNA_ID=CAMNT_0015351423 /DNA_START=45 /DNA_END=1165 /DNA_ORIENTATION=+
MLGHEADVKLWMRREGRRNRKAKALERMERRRFKSWKERYDVQEGDEDTLWSPSNVPPEFLPLNNEASRLHKLYFSSFSNTLLNQELDIEITSYCSDWSTFSRIESHYHDTWSNPEAIPRSWSGIRGDITLLIPPQCWEINDIRNLRLEINEGTTPRQELHISTGNQIISYDKFETEEKILREKLKGVKPFTISLNSFEHFSHSKKRHTLWVHPEVENLNDGDPNPLWQTQRIIGDTVRDHFFFLSARSRTTHHLSLGKFTSLKSLQENKRKCSENWEEIKFVVKEVYITSRREVNGPLIVRKVIPLGGDSTPPYFPVNPLPHLGIEDQSICVYNLPEYVTPEELKSKFEQHFAVDTAEVKITMNDDGVSSGWG